MGPKDAAGMANRVDPDKTVWSGSTLCAQAYLSENLGTLRYCKTHKILDTQKFAAIVLKSAEQDGFTIE